MSTQPDDVSWLISSFVDQTPGVVEAIVVSSDGLLMAMSNGLDRAGGDRFAAVASGLIGLAYGAAGRFGGGRVNEVIVEMDNALLLVTGQLMFLVNFLWSLGRGTAAAPNPWQSTTLEWTLPSPPPHGNFDATPTVTRWPYDYSVEGARNDFSPQTGGPTQMPTTTEAPS